MSEVSQPHTLKQAYVGPTVYSGAYSLAGSAAVLCGVQVQGHLAHKKQTPPRTLQ